MTAKKSPKRNTVADTRTTKTTTTSTNSPTQTRTLQSRRCHRRQTQRKRAGMVTRSNTPVTREDETVAEDAEAVYSSSSSPRQALMGEDGEEEDDDEGGGFPADDASRCDLHWRTRGRRGGRKRGAPPKPRLWRTRRGKRSKNDEMGENDRAKRNRRRKPTRRRGGDRRIEGAATTSKIPIAKTTTS